jgi:hypothetical protein
MRQIKESMISPAFCIGCGRRGGAKPCRLGFLILVVIEKFDQQQSATAAKG